VATVPTFFFSHTRQDKDAANAKLIRFFEDLEVEVAAWCQFVLTDNDRLGSMDPRIPQGENWDNVLSRGLSSDKVFVAVYTPLYFVRPYCGKELFVFLMRSPNLGIDTNGALTGVCNVLPIRWMPEDAYAINGGTESIIPPFLRLVQDGPEDLGHDAERTNAIQKYRKKGMRSCVNPGTSYYAKLLELFAKRIRDTGEVSPGGNFTFATAENAFMYDWLNHFAPPNASPSAPSEPSGTPEPANPIPLKSVVMFHITRRLFSRDPHRVDFADQLISETSPGANDQTDGKLQELLSDVRIAGVCEGFSTFNAAANPVVPTNPDGILRQLGSLSKSGVVTVLTVDPDVLLDASLRNGEDAVGQIITSTEWTGPVLIPTLDDTRVNDHVAKLNLPQWVVRLSSDSEKRSNELRRIFVNARGRAMRSNMGVAHLAEQMPALVGVSAKEP
jgi:hypothetical protein